MAGWDVIVVGGGNAALCAALSAKEKAKRVLVPERAPEDEAGGNSRFTAGLLRIVHNGAQDLTQLIELSKEELSAPISGLTPPSSSWTTWRGSPSTAATPTSRRSS
jgi:predicted oxidoreductase